MVGLTLTDHIGLDDGYTVKATAADVARLAIVLDRLILHLAEARGAMKAEPGCQELASTARVAGNDGEGP